MKYLIIAGLLSLMLNAEETVVDNNMSTTLEEKSPQEETVPKEEVVEKDMVVIEDTSGMSDAEVRDVATKADETKEETISIRNIVDLMDANGSVDLRKLQKNWEEQSPTPTKYDWVKTSSGEWFKGTIKALYDDSLEFDSDEIGIYSFDFSDVVSIKSYNIISVNIEDAATFPGIIRLKDDKIKIIQGSTVYEFEKKYIVSFAPAGEKERNYWSGKMSVGLDVRSGNINQYDFSAKVNLKRRTSESHLAFDYLGRISSKDDIETSNDHRFNEKYDRYITRHFFWTPIFGEYYTDQYRNIDHQISGGIGIGYTPVDTKKIEWSISGGPAYLYTRYHTVVEGSSLETSSAALELSTKIDIKINSVTDFIYDYRLTYADAASGRYKHHMVFTFENELTSWLDFDITGVWDYILLPEPDDTGLIPEKDDFQLLVGIGVDF